MLSHHRQCIAVLKSTYITIALMATMLSLGVATAAAAAGEKDEMRSNDSLMPPISSQQQDQRGEEADRAAGEEKVAVRQVAAADDVIVVGENGNVGGGGSEKFCGIHSSGFEPLHALMDQICELCHDFFSHYRPNTRVECRADCFRTMTFKKCLRLFKPSRTRRHLMQFLMVE